VLDEIGSRASLTAYAAVTWLDTCRVILASPLSVSFQTFQLLFLHPLTLRLSMFNSIRLTSEEGSPAHHAHEYEHTMCMVVVQFPFLYIALLALIFCRKLLSHNPFTISFAPFQPPQLSISTSTSPFPTLPVNLFAYPSASPLARHHSCLSG